MEKYLFVDIRNIGKKTKIGMNLELVSGNAVELASLE